jgi:hypothetical protein
MKKPPRRAVNPPQADWLFVRIGFRCLNPEFRRQMTEDRSKKPDDRRQKSDNE